MDIDPDVIAPVPGEPAVPGVDADPDADAGAARSAAAPSPRSARSPGSAPSRRSGVDGGAEGGEHAVALVLDDHPVVGGDRGVGEIVVRLRRGRPTRRPASIRASRVDPSMSLKRKVTVPVGSATPPIVPGPARQVRTPRDRCPPARRRRPADRADRDPPEPAGHLDRPPVPIDVARPLAFRGRPHRAVGALHEVDGPVVRGLGRPSRPSSRPNRPVGPRRPKASLVVAGARPEAAVVGDDEAGPIGRVRHADEHAAPTQSSDRRRDARPSRTPRRARASRYLQPAGRDRADRRQRRAAGRSASGPNRIAPRRYRASPGGCGASPVLSGPGRRWPRRPTRRGRTQRRSSGPWRGSTNDRRCGPSRPGSSARRSPQPGRRRGRRRSRRWYGEARDLLARSTHRPEGGPARRHRPWPRTRPSGRRGADGRRWTPTPTSPGARARPGRAVGGGIEAEGVDADRESRHRLRGRRRRCWRSATRRRRSSAGRRRREGLGGRRAEVDDAGALLRRRRSRSSVPVAAQIVPSGAAASEAVPGRSPGPTDSCSSSGRRTGRARSFVPTHTAPSAATAIVVDAVALHPRDGDADELPSACCRSGRGSRGCCRRSMSFRPRRSRRSSRRGRRPPGRVRSTFRRPSGSARGPRASAQTEPSVASLMSARPPLFKPIPMTAAR